MAILVATQITGTLGVTSTITALNITASLLGTASYALSASWAPAGTTLITGSTYPITASYALTASALSGFSSSNLLYLQCDDNNAYPVTLTNYSGSVTFAIGQSPVVGTNGFINIGNVSVFTTGSSYNITASYATTASYALNGGGSGTTLTTGSSYPITASWANTASVMATNTLPYITLTTSSVSIPGITCSLSDAKEYVTFNTGSVTYTFTSSNVPVAGTYSETSVFINNTFTGANTASLTFPTGWIWVGLKPTFITGSKNAYLNLESFGGNVIATFGQQY